MLKQHSITNPAKKRGDRRPRFIYRDIKGLDVVRATDGELFHRGTARIGGADVTVYSHCRTTATFFPDPKGILVTVAEIVPQKHETR